MAFAQTAATNDLQLSAALGSGGADNPFIAMGWIMPTALATSMTLFGSTGGTASPRVRARATDSTKIEIFNATVTTAHSWLGSTSILANNQWTFIAILVNAETTTDTCAAAAWVATELNPPVEETLTYTAGAGNVPAAPTTFFIGSTSTTDTAGFIGILGMFGIFSFGTANANHILDITTAGAITANTKEITYRRFVLPFWEGRFRSPHQCATALSVSTGSYIADFYECSPGIAPNAGGGLQKRGNPTSNTLPFVSITTSATTSTLIRGPRAYDFSNPLVMWKKR